jgi:hypothetical protein
VTTDRALMTPLLVVAVVTLGAAVHARPSGPLALLLLTVALVATLLGFALLVPVVALLLARAPRTPAGFAAAVALTLLTVFVFSKRAFANYGFCVIGALGTALAAVRRPTQ